MIILYFIALGLTLFSFSKCTEEPWMPSVQSSDARVFLLYINMNVLSTNDVSLGSTL